MTSSIAGLGSNESLRLPTAYDITFQMDYIAKPLK